MASGKGVLVVVSAGNEGSSGWGYITAPSDAQNILCVGATSADSNRAWFSSYGPSSDGRTKPEIMSVGRQTTVLFSYAGLGAGDGTSFASPNLAGAAACLWQAHPGLTNRQIIQAILWNSNIYWQPNDQYGYGIPNMYLAALNPLQPNSNKEEPATYSLKAYPNPASDFLIIRLPMSNNKADRWQISLTSTDGTIKYQEQTTSPGGLHNIDTSRLPGGLYFVQLSNGYTHMSGRIVILNQ
jgi:serine protease AprX